MYTVAIVNPRAGRRKTIQIPSATEILETQAPGHAIQLTRDAIRRGARTIMAVGGDGTINEVVNGFFEEEQLIATDTEYRVNRLRAASEESVLVEIDGESVGKLPIEISIVPKAIRVWMP